jgi:hypothetical protein
MFRFFWHRFNIFTVVRSSNIAILILDSITCYYIFAQFNDLPFISLILKFAFKVYNIIIIITTPSIQLIRAYHFFGTVFMVKLSPFISYKIYHQQIIKYYSLRFFIYHVLENKQAGNKYSRMEVV